MSEQYALKAEKKERAGKGVARALRREGRIPGVIYGDKKDPVSISLPVREVTKEWMKGTMYTHLCELTVGSEKNLVLCRGVQVHPVTDQVEHVDFLRVSPKTKLRVHVPVRFINQDKSPGLKDKGILNIVNHELEMLCPATAIPEFIEVDVAPYKIGDPIKLSAVKMPQGIEVVTHEDDLTLATITPPKLADEVAVSAAAAGTEAASADAAAKPDAKAAAAKPDAKAPAPAAKK